MMSHGQNPSRRPDDQPVQGNVSDRDVRDPGSHGSDRSRGPGDPPRTGPSANEGAGENWFPASSRYRRLSDPISGGMGVVYKALDVNLDIEVAIKRIRPEFAANADLISRFEREAKLQVRLRHANLVQVRDYSKDSIGPYIVMDWIEGESLAEVIERAGPMDWQRAAVLISKVALALQVAHDAGIIHRDVKPANILLDASGEPFVTDFGLARIEATQSRSSETATNAMLGTINFASPEQQRNPRNACFQSDIWSLGATLYKTVTSFDVLAMRESLIPEQLRPIVLKATEHAIDARYGTMRLMSQALQATKSGSGSKPFEPKPGDAPPQEDIADVWRRTQDRIEKAHGEANEIAKKRQDYAEAVKILETVPEQLRKKKLYDELIRRRDRVVALDAGIRDSVAQMRSEGLRDAINELLKLQANRHDMKKLLEHLPPEEPPKEQAPTQAATKKPVRPAEHLPPEEPPKEQAPTQAATKTPVRSPLLVAPFDAKQAKASQEAWAKHLGVGVEITNSLGMKFRQWIGRPRTTAAVVEITNSIGMKFRVIPPGTFDMSSPESEPQRDDDEARHKVTITQPKLLGVFPVTQAEWTKVMGSNPSKFTSVSGQDTSRFPVEQVSWDDCQEFLKRMNESHAIKGWRYRLPTEAEWEYACRAGTVTPYWFGGELNGTQANCYGNHPYQTGKGPCLPRPSVVGSYGANPFGLYDQHGNVWEWCQDRYGAYDASVHQDPRGPSSGSSRVLRGGSWYGSANSCRSARRGSNTPSYRRDYIGFRLLCELS